MPDVPPAIGPVSALAAILRGLRVVDLSPVLERGIPNWPMHPPLVIDPVREVERDGDYCQLLMLSERTGTHVDGPAQFHPSMIDRSIDNVPAGHLIAPAVLYDFAELALEPGQLLTLADVEAYEQRTGIAVGAGEIAPINFGWMRRHWRTDHRSSYFVPNAPGIAEDAIIHFRDREPGAIGCDTVACDMPGVDGVGGATTGHTTHRLPRNILIIEMLANLEQLSPRSLFMATPLRIRRSSGSPPRPLACCETA